tara:strand:- start:829 stop:1053 length:225 start_codon:yes stop_codon:yes gene_type:complete
MGGITMIEKSYKQELIDRGISKTRAEDLAKAVDDLHMALAKCDLENRKKFNLSRTVADLVNDFGTIEWLANDFK